LLELTAQGGPTMRHTRLTISYSLAVMLAAAALQQIAWGDDDRPEAPASGGDSIRLTLVDRRISANLAIDAQAEIQLVQFAISHARDPGVKRFAETMAIQFDSLATHLDALSGSLASAIWNITAGDDPRPPSPIRLINAERMLMRIKLEVVREGASYLQAELQSLPADEFDRNYLRAHILRQIQMLGTLKALERYASPGYANTLAEATKVVQHGLEQAKTTLASLEPLRTKPVDGAKITAADRK
jgi:predicted outer membrane protein